MGFRCPACKTDFANDREAFKDHLVVCEFGRDMVSMVLNTTGDEANREAMGVAKVSVRASD